ncbi:hypothetical protein AHAS_Ahas05G0226600 [Arachis hypogaea]
MILKTLLHDLHLIIAGGSLFLFDGTVLRYFRKDGHNWRMRKHGKTVKEAHEKLKEVLTCCIATMPMVKKMKNFRDEAIGCWNSTMENRQENLFPPSLPNQQLLFFDEELWLMAEERAQEILCTIQPNLISEVTRKKIIEYVWRLIRGYYGAEVLPFGSVPLKTYLPDGDIDLTALSHEKDEEDLANMVCSMLQSKGNSEFQVTDIQHIRAKVQVVKCTVKNIVVDISFNQMAGLCAMHFLEQVKSNLC